MRYVTQISSYMKMNESSDIDLHPTRTPLIATDAITGY